MNKNGALMKNISQKTPPGFHTDTRKKRGRRGGSRPRKGESEGMLFPKPQKTKKKKIHHDSILRSRKDWCWLCDKPKPTEEHHIFGGPNRKASEEYGLKVYLCPECHRTGPAAAHSCKGTADILHKAGQRAFEEQVGSRREFVKIFGKNYL